MRNYVLVIDQVISRVYCFSGQRHGGSVGLCDGIPSKSCIVSGDVYDDVHVDVDIDVDVDVDIDADVDDVVDVDVDVELSSC